MSHPFRLAIVSLTLSALVFGGTFQGPTNYQTNPGPTGIVAGDFNRDGNVDLVITVCGDKQCVAPGSVGVLFGHGNGTFRLGGVFFAGPTGTTADTLASGDFNGDGTPDVVVVNNGINKFGSVSVLIADGGGGFLPPVSYPVGGSTPVWAAVGDFDGDHKLDLAISVTTTDSIAVLQGKGDGTFRPAVTYPVEGGPQGITTGDVNHDGRLDLVAANECGADPGCRLGTVSVLLGNGDGTFQKQLSFLAGMFPLSVAMADFNGDGHPDLAVADPCGTDPTCASNGGVAILLGNGDGSFQPLVNYPSTGMDTARLTVGDFNGDHHPDVVALNVQSTGLAVLLGNGDGTLQPGIAYAAGMIPIWAVAADFNRDQAPDLAVANESESDISVFLNSGGARVTLTSAPNPSRVGQTVTFTAKVTATLQGYGTPTGTVTFTTGGQSLGIAPLSAGTATITSSVLQAGRHEIRANYSGDTQYNPNFSPPIAQTVKP